MTVPYPPDAQLNWLSRYIPLEPFFTGSAAQSMLEVGSGHRGVGCVFQHPFVGAEVSFQQSPHAPMLGVEFDGHLLPFKAMAFDTVLSLDTFEHIAPLERLSFLWDLARVASRQVIIGFPADLDGMVSDKCMQDIFAQMGRGQPDWLYEHAEHGMPSSAEFEAALNELTGWRWRALPTTGDLAATLFSLADTLPALRSSIVEALENSGEELARFIRSGQFGSACRKVYLIERDDPCLPIVNMSRLETIIEALCCPDCGGDIEPASRAPGSCIVCRRVISEDERSIWTARPRKSSQPRPIIFEITPDFFGKPDWLSPLHNYLVAFSADEPCLMRLIFDPNVINSEEILFLLQPLLVPFGDQPFAMLELCEASAEKVPAERVITLPNEDEALRKWSPGYFRAVYRHALTPENPEVLAKARTKF